MEGFRKKIYSTMPRESQALTWGLRTNTLPSVFSGNLSKVYLILVANVRDFYAVVFGTLRGKLVEYPRLLIISPRSLKTSETFHDVQNANHRCRGHATMSTESTNDQLITVHAPFLAIAPNQNATLQFTLCMIDPQC